MRRRAAAALGLTFALSSCGLRSVVPDGAPRVAQARLPPYGKMPLLDVSESRLDAERSAGRTIPFFKGAIESPLDGKTYHFVIAGSNPNKSSGATHILYVPIVIVFHFPDGTVLDPRKPACNDSVSVEQRLLRGPNFVPADLVSNGVYVGKAQLGDGFQRAEFWKIVKLHGAEYHTILSPIAKPVVIDVNAPSGSTTNAGVCFGASHRIGKISFRAFKSIANDLTEKYATPAALALLFNYNTFIVLPSGCCFLGIHGALKRPTGIQVLAWSAYNDAGSYAYLPTAEDISISTHEIGETLNDPFVRNATPAWGHIGQYPLGCSNLFEVGDPLTGVNFRVKHGRFAYHPQELAFFSWFYRTHSIGTGGKYSFEGTIRKPQPLCR
ncbi:MAG: hypothetical protein JO263_00605 [Candidatus Eremiobacteraeota bacterium]|nr:hypothetical protein [Candidatus Eremiobacteraeota bacterium]